MAISDREFGEFKSKFDLLEARVAKIEAKETSHPVAKRGRKPKTEETEETE